MRTHTSSHYNRYMIGGMLICLGTAVLLDQQHIVALQDMWEYWPLLLVAGGAIRMIDPETPRDRIGGCWTFFIGAWLFANVEGWFGMDYANSWPFLLIGWGILLLLRPLLHADRRVREENNDAR